MFTELSNGQVFSLANDDINIFNEVFLYFNKIKLVSSLFRLFEIQAMEALLTIILTIYAWATYTTYSLVLSFVVKWVGWTEIFLQTCEFTIPWSITFKLKKIIISIYSPIYLRYIMVKTKEGWHSSQE